METTHANATAYFLAIGNKIKGGRAVGTEYYVQTGSRIVSKHETREDAQAALVSLRTEAR